MNAAFPEPAAEPGAGRTRHGNRRALLVVVWAAVLLIYLIIIPRAFADASYVLNVVTTAAVLALMSLGVWLTFTIGRINIGQAGFAMIGGYVAGILINNYGMSFWLCLPLAGLTAALAGALIGWPILRLKGVYFAMLTLSLTEAIRLAFLNAAFVTQGASGIVNLPLPGELRLFGVVLVAAFEPGQRLAFYYLAAALLLTGLLLLWRIHASRLGRVFQALRQDEALAASIGIPVARYRVIAYAICCGYGGVGGAFFTAFQQNIYPSTYQVFDSVYLMMYCFVGGLGYLAGPIVGAFTMVIGFEALRDLARYQTLAYALAMILCLRFLPDGLLSLGAVGTSRRR